MKAILEKFTSALKYIPASVRTCIVQMLTGKDNATVDIGRVTYLLAFLVLIGLTVFMAVVHKTFDPLAFSTSAGALHVGGSAGLAIKHKTEPDGSTGEQ